jgi:transposase
MEWVACVGIDWADQKHDYALRGHQGEEESGTFESRPEGVHGWVARLRARYPEGTIVVALEQSRGALLYALSMYEFLALVPINPRAATAYRQSLHLSGAKDDPVDAGLIRDFAAAHLDKLRVWRADDALTRTLRLLVEFRRNLVDQRTGLTQVLTDAIKQYFPQILEWFSNGVLARAFLSQWSTLEQTQSASDESIRALVRSCSRKSQPKIDELIIKIRSAVALTTDQAVITAMAVRVRSLIALLDELDEQVRNHDQAIAQLWSEHADQKLFASFPGAGPVLAPRLAAAFGSDRSRFEDAIEMQNYSGTSPVTERSGKRQWVHSRWQRPKFLHQTFHEFAEASIPHCAWARAFYHRQREHGAGHRAAIRALAFRWIRVLFSCWKTNTAYDDAAYLDALKRRGSPLADRLAA